jgi:hypothetical protein
MLPGPRSTFPAAMKPDRLLVSAEFLQGLAASCAEPVLRGPPKLTCLIRDHRVVGSLRRDLSARRAAMGLPFQFQALPQQKMAQQRTTTKALVPTAKIAWIPGSDSKE